MYFVKGIPSIDDFVCRQEPRRAGYLELPERAGIVMEVEASANGVRSIYVLAAQNCSVEVDCLAAATGKGDAPGDQDQSIEIQASMDIKIPVNNQNAVSRRISRQAHTARHINNRGIPGRGIWPASLRCRERPSGIGSEVLTGSSVARTEGSWRRRGTSVIPRRQASVLRARFEFVDQLRDVVRPRSLCSSSLGGNLSERVVDRHTGYAVDAGQTLGRDAIGENTRVWKGRSVVDRVFANA